MKVSFKISKKGSRFHPKPKPESPSDVPENDQLPEVQVDTRRKRSVDVKDDRADGDAEEMLDVSFILNIFEDGYSIQNPSEINAGHQHDDPEFLRPYDRTSESLFTAIERGRIPSDFLDDIPCRYSNGAIMCEVRDYRKDSSKPGVNASPSIAKVSLKMSLDNVVKEIPLISDTAWTYGDLMEAESRILKVLQPRLCLDPTPNLDRLCKDPTSLKLNLNIPGLRRKRLRQTSGTATAIQNVGVGNPRHLQDHEPGTVFSAPGPSSAQDMVTDGLSSMMSSIHGKRGNQDGQLSSVDNLNKRTRSNPMTLDGNQQQHVASSHMDTSINAPDSRWKSMFERNFNQDTGAMASTMRQQGIRYSAQRMDKSEPRLQQRLPQQFTRSSFAKAPWNNMQPLKNNNRKEEDFQRRTSAQSPCVSSGGLPKSGEFSSGSMGMRFGAVATAVVGSSLREKSVVTSVSAVGTRSSNSSTNDSMQRQHQAQIAANWRSNTLPMIPILSGVGYPSTVGNMSGSFTAISPVGEEVDRSMHDRFSKIKMLTTRFQLHCKKNKIDEYKETTTFPTQQLIHSLFSDDAGLKDEACKMPLSKSLEGGNMNVCKTRVLKFAQAGRVRQGDGEMVPKLLQTRLILSERPSDGTVAMHYGELDDCDYLAEDELLPTLPNTHTADLVAAQFSTLMARDGCYLEGDHVEPINMVQSPANAEIPNQSTNEVAAKPSNDGTENVSKMSTRMHNSLSSQGGSLPSEPQPSLYQQQQLQQNPHSLMQPQLQRSASSLPSHLDARGQHSNMQQSPHQSQLLPQQQQQQQQQRKMMMGPGNVGMGWNIGGNPMVKLEGLGNVTGMGGARSGTGIVPPIISGMCSNQGSAISNAISGMGQNPLSSTISNAISQQLRSGPLAPPQAAGFMATQLRMPPSKPNVSGGPAANRNVMRPPSGIDLYMNQQQLNLQQMQHQHQHQQRSRSLLQTVLSPPQQGGSRSIGMPHQQQMRRSTPVSPQIYSGAVQPPMSTAGNQEGPASSQTSNFPM